MWTREGMWSCRIAYASNLLVNIIEINQIFRSFLLRSHWSRCRQFCILILMFCFQILHSFLEFFASTFSLTIVMNSLCKQLSLSLFSDFESQMFVVVNELNNQLIIVKESIALSLFITFFTFLIISSNLEIIRRRVFDAFEIWTWIIAKHELYWSFVNNIWVLNIKKKLITKKNIRTQYFVCRFWKEFVDKSENFELRFKTIRHVDFCDMKFTKIWQYDEFETRLSINIILFKEKCKVHNHDLNYFDQTKINDEIRIVVDRKMIKSYRFAHINRNMQRVKWKINHVALKTTDDLIMNLKTVHNANANFLKINFDSHRRDNDLCWQNQLKICYEDMQRLSEDYVSQKLMIIRQFEKKRNKKIKEKRKEMKKKVEDYESHAIAFANRDKWFRYSTRIISN